MPKSFQAGEFVQPAFGLCWRYGHIHTDRDIDGVEFLTCICCQADLVEVTPELRTEQEAE